MIRIMNQLRGGEKYNLMLKRNVDCAYGLFRRLSSQTRVSESTGSSE